MPRLQLTNDEYDTLHILLMNIGGDPTHSKRRHIASISKQMDNSNPKAKRSDARFDKHFYMVDSNRMYWKNDDGTPDYVFKDSVHKATL